MVHTPGEVLRPFNIKVLLAQNCEDMFVLSKWNQSKTYSFEIKRDFGTDYGICCWYTPQLNFTEVAAHMRHHGLQEPDYGYFFHRIPRVIIFNIDIY